MSSRLLLVIIGALVMNTLCFLLMRHDKQCAINRKPRVPERVLLLSAGCFGALGGILAMYLLPHKTNHWEFKTFIPVMLMIQTIILGFVIYKLC